MYSPESSATAYTPSATYMYTGIVPAETVSVPRMSAHPARNPPGRYPIAFASATGDDSGDPGDLQRPGGISPPLGAAPSCPTFELPREPSHIGHDCRCAVRDRCAGLRPTRCYTETEVPRRMLRAATDALLLSSATPPATHLDHQPPPLAMILGIFQIFLTPPRPRANWARTEDGNHLQFSTVPSVPGKTVVVLR